jgi:hypothetical protein
MGLNIKNKFTLCSIIELLSDALKAKNLLSELHSQIGPYGIGKIEQKTLRKINNYFDFDDSE